MIPSPHSLAALKTQAKALRAELARQGHQVSHAASLEMLAKQLGHRDWNTLHASVGNEPPTPLTLGQRVRGQYLGHDFEGSVLALRSLGAGARTTVTIRFDKAVDVIPFDGLSNLRQQVTATLTAAGDSTEAASDGTPHMSLTLS